MVGGPARLAAVGSGILASKWGALQPSPHICQPCAATPIPIYELPTSCCERARPCNQRTLCRAPLALGAVRARSDRGNTSRWALQSPHCTAAAATAAAAACMALMPVVRPRPPQGNSQAPWGQLLVAAAAVVFLVLLGTGRIRIAPSISSAVPASPPGGSNPALRWADHPQSLALPGQLPHWLGAAARPPGSLQLEDGPLLNETVRLGRLY